MYIKVTKRQFDRPCDLIHMADSYDRSGLYLLEIKGDTGEVSERRLMYVNKETKACFVISGQDFHSPEMDIYSGEEIVKKEYDLKLTAGHSPKSALKDMFDTIAPEYSFKALEAFGVALKRKNDTLEHVFDNRVFDESFSFSPLSMTETEKEAERQSILKLTNGPFKPLKCIEEHESRVEVLPGLIPDGYELAPYGHVPGDFVINLTKEILKGIKDLNK